MEKLLSIIMPMYNVEKTVEKAVESILSSQKDFFELILVNDGSPDRTAEIVKKYTDDPRVIYIEKENGGQATARNFGIKKASGKYVAFIDSDDYYSDGAVDRFEAYISDDDFDVIGFGFYYEKVENGRVCCTDANAISRRIEFTTDTIEVPHKYILTSSKLLTQTVWCKLWKKSIIDENDIQFDTSVSHSEDTKFCYDFYRYADRIVFLPDINYCYCLYVNNNSKNCTIFDKRRGASIISGVSVAFDSFIKLSSEHGYSNDFLSFMYENFFREYTFCSKKIFLKSNNISKAERYRLFDEFLNDKGFLFLREHYFGSFRFYRWLYTLYEHNLKKTAYMIYYKKVAQKIKVLCQ